MSDKKPTALSRVARLSDRVCASRRVLGVLGCGLLTLLACGLKVAVKSAGPMFIMALHRVNEMGAWGVPLLYACEAAAFLVLLPISPLHIGVGFLYGPVQGTLLAWSAYTLGCIPPFVLVRVPMLTDRFVQMRRRMDVLDGVFGAVELEPFKLIVCLRLSPLLPSTLNSYLLGLTNVPLRTYVAASCIGALPNLCAYVYLGTLLDSLADIAAGRVQQSPLSLTLLITGGAATVAAVVYISRIATRRINAARMRSGEDMESASLLAASERS